MTHAPQSRGSLEDSLARSLLCVPCLQQQVATVLLQRLATAAGDLGSPLPSALLSQFRWLDQLSDAEALIKLLLEVMAACPLELQREIITFLPEVVPEKEHTTVVSHLETAITEDLSLMGASLEAMQSLELGPSLQARVIQLVTSLLNAIAPADVPLAIRFLLISATTASAVTDVACALRAELHCVPGAEPRATALDRKAKAPVSAASSADAALVEALRTGLRFRPLAGAELMLQIRAALLPHRAKKSKPASSDHAGARIIDLWVLLVLHRDAVAPATRASVEALVREGFAAGAWSDKLLKQALMQRGDALVGVFPSVLAIAGALLQTSPSSAAAPLACAGGSLLYQLAFKAFPDAQRRQSTLGALAAHAGGAPHESWAALGALRATTDADPAAILQFKSFVSGLLDLSDRLSEDALRLLYALMAQLAAATCQANAEGGSGSGFMPGTATAAAAWGGTAVEGTQQARFTDGQDDLHILLRKQLAGASPRLLRLGVLGACAYVSRLSLAPGQGAAQALLMLRGVLKAVSHTGSLAAEALLLDELAAMLECMWARKEHLKEHPRELVQWLQTHVTSAFDETFAEDLAPGQKIAHSPPHGTLPDEAWMNLDAPEAVLALRVAPVACAPPPARRTQRSGSADGVGAEGARLCALFRLLVAVTRFDSDRLDGIDALLGAPLRMPAAATALCAPPALPPASALAAMALAASWLRQLLGGFAAAAAPAARHTAGDKKLLQRLQQLAQLEGALVEALAAQPRLVAMLPHLGASYGELAHAAAAPAGGKKKKAPAKGPTKMSAAKGKAPAKRRKQSPAAEEEDEEKEDESEGESESEDEPPPPAPGPRDDEHGAVPAPGSTAGTDASHWRALLLRSLPFSAFTCLAIPSINAQSVFPSREPLPAGAAALPGAALLLRELAACLAHALPAGSAWKGRGKPSAGAGSQVPGPMRGADRDQLLAMFVAVLPALQEHLSMAVEVLRLAAGDKPSAHAPESSRVPLALPPLTVGPTDHARLAAHVTNATDAAMAVIASACACLRAVLCWPGLALPTSAPLLRALLSAFDPAASAGTTLPHVSEAFPRAFAAWAAACARVSASSAPAALGAVKLLQAAVGCAESLAATSEHADLEVGPLREALSRAAGEVLEAPFWRDTADSCLGGASGRCAALALLLKLQLSCAAEPLRALQTAALQLLPATTKLRTHGAVAALSHVEGAPTLTLRALPAWYKAVWQETVSQLQAWAKRSCDKAACETFSAARAALRHGQDLAAILKALTALLQHHTGTGSKPLMGIAVRQGGGAMRALLRVGPLMRASFEESQLQQQAVDLLKTLQVSTRQLQVVCTEVELGGSSGAGSVPDVRKNCHSFVNLVSKATHGTSLEGTTDLGLLKHRDVSGKEIGSQLRPHSNSDGDGSDSSDDEEEEEEEDENAQHRRDRARAQAEAQRRKSDKEGALAKAAAAAKKRKAAGVPPDPESSEEEEAEPQPAPRRQHFAIDDAAGESSDGEEEEDEDEDEDA